MQKNDNKAIFEVIQKFVENWSRITYDTAFTFNSVIRQVSSFLNPEERVNEDPNVSMERSERMVYNFDDCFDKFNIDELYLPTDMKLRKFYLKNIPRKVTDFERGERIPS